MQVVSGQAEMMARNELAVIEAMHLRISAQEQEFGQLRNQALEEVWRVKEEESSRLVSEEAASNQRWQMERWKPVHAAEEEQARKEAEEAAADAKNMAHAYARSEQKLQQTAQELDLAREQMTRASERNRATASASDDHRVNVAYGKVASIREELREYVKRHEAAASVIEDTRCQAEREIMATRQAEQRESFDVGFRLDRCSGFLQEQRKLP